jgi:plastocyanin
MNTKSFVLPLAAALAFAAAPARAQHDHGAMQHGGQDAAKMEHGGHDGAKMEHGSSAAAHGIVEGTVKDGVRVVDVEVTGDGFVPAKIKVKKGERVRLNVTRKTDKTCATEIVVTDYGINQPLPLNKTVTVELTPKSSGEIKYACAMGHIAGVLFVP